MENTWAGAHSWAKRPLSDGVHLHNVRSAGQQLIGDILKLLPGDQGLFKQGAPPAGQQENHGVLLRQAGHQVQRRLGAPEGVPVGDGVPPLITGAAGDFPGGVAVLGDHHAGVDSLPQAVLGGPGHLPGGLARRRQHHPAGELPPLEGALHRRVGLNGLDCPGNDNLGVGTQAHSCPLLISG